MVKKLKTRGSWVLFCLAFGLCNLFFHFDNSPGEGVKFGVKSAQAEAKCCPKGAHYVDAQGNCIMY